MCPEQGSLKQRFVTVHRDSIVTVIEQQAQPGRHVAILVTGIISSGKEPTILCQVFDWEMAAFPRDIEDHGDLVPGNLAGNVGAMA